MLFTYSVKDWFLFTYGIISPLFITLFLATVLIFNSNSVLYFPKEFIMYIYHIIIDTNTFNLITLANFTPCIIFYYLVIRICKSVYVNKIKNIR